MTCQIKGGGPACLKAPVRIVWKGSGGGRSRTGKERGERAFKYQEGKKKEEKRRLGRPLERRAGGSRGTRGKENWKARHYKTADCLLAMTMGHFRKRGCTTKEGGKRKHGCERGAEER